MRIQQIMSNFIEIGSFSFEGKHKYRDISKQETLGKRPNKGQKQIRMELGYNSKNK